MQSVFHSITNSGLIAGGQNSSKERQTIFFTAANPMHKDPRDPQDLDLTKPRLASYKQKWKRDQDTVYWVDMQLAQRKGLKFKQEVTQLSLTMHSQLIVSRDGIWRTHIRQSICVTSTTTDDHHKDNWMKELDSEVAGSSKGTQRSQPKNSNYQERRDP